MAFDKNSTIQVIIDGAPCYKTIEEILTVGVADLNIGESAFKVSQSNGKFIELAQDGTLTAQGLNVELRSENALSIIGTTVEGGTGEVLISNDQSGNSIRLRTNGGVDLDTSNNRTFQVNSVDVP